MNVNDTEIAWSILQGKGYLRTADLNEVQLSSVFILPLMEMNYISAVELICFCARRLMLSFWLHAP